MRRVLSNMLSNTNVERENLVVRVCVCVEWREGKERERKREARLVIAYIHSTTKSSCMHSIAEKNLKHSAEKPQA